MGVYIRNNKDNQTDLDSVGDLVFIDIGRRGPNCRHDGNKGKNSDKDVGNLSPDTLKEGNLFLFGKLVGTILFKALLSFGGRQARLQQIFALSEFLETLELGSTMPLKELGAVKDGLVLRFIFAHDEM